MLETHDDVSGLASRETLYVAQLQVRFFGVDDDTGPLLPAFLNESLLCLCSWLMSPGGGPSQPTQYEEELLYNNV